METSSLTKFIRKELTLPNHKDLDLRMRKEVEYSDYGRYKQEVIIYIRKLLGL